MLFRSSAGSLHSALAVAAARDALRAAGLDPGLVRPPAYPSPAYEI